MAVAPSVTGVAFRSFGRLGLRRSHGERGRVDVTALGGDEHRVTRGPDGKYRRARDHSARSPVFLFLIWKIFFLYGSPWLLCCFLFGNAWENFRSLGMGMVGVLAFWRTTFHIFMHCSWGVPRPIRDGYQRRQVVGSFAGRDVKDTGRTGRYCHRQAP